MTSAEHFEDDRLLALADGELEAAERETASAHVSSCAACLQRSEELQEASAEYAELHQWAKRLAAPAPRAWADLRQRMAEIEAPKPARTRSWNAIPAWLAAAAAVIIAVLIWRGGPTAVSAESLLKNAEASERSVGRAPSSLRVRTLKKTFVRPAVLGGTVASGDDELPALFASARYDWDEPLAVRSFVRWRDTLPDREDRVERVQSGGRKAYRVRTSTHSGTLSEATLTLVGDTLRPVAGTFQFRAGELVEIDQISPAASSSRSTPSMPLQSEGAPAETIDEASQELKVIAALHRIGADLGDPVELRREGSTLVVVAIALQPARQEQMRKALAQVPAVEVRFEDPRARYDQSRPDRPTAGSGTQARPSLQALEQRLGSAAMVEQFANDALDLSESVMQRAFALRQLAVRFSAERVKSLSAADREVLATMRRTHTGALNARLADLRALLEEVAPSGSTNNNVRVPADWQPATQQLTAAAQKLDEVITRVFAGAGEADLDQLGPALRSASGLAAEYTRQFGEASP